MAEEIVIGDLFWDDADPERSQDSPEEILHDDYMPNTVVRFQQATRHPDFYGFYVHCAGEEDQYFYFATQEEAEAELAKMQETA